MRIRIAGEFVDAPFDLRTEVPDETLDRPRRRVPKRADGVTLDLFGHVEELIDLALLRATINHAHHDAPHPSGALAAWRALTATLVLVKIRQPRDGAHDIGGLVHHDHGGRAEARLQAAQRVEIHECIGDL